MTKKMSNSAFEGEAWRERGSGDVSKWMITTSGDFSLSPALFVPGGSMYSYVESLPPFKAESCKSKLQGVSQFTTQFSNRCLLEKG